MGVFNIFNKKKKEDLNQGLEKTRNSFFSKIGRAIAGKSKVDDEVLDSIEEALITADVGVDTTIKIIDRLEAKVAKDKYVSGEELNSILKNVISDLLKENQTLDVNELTVPEGKSPYVIMVVGVNGVGKTTTIGKIANQFKSDGKSVLLGAGDTFRAAAIEQLAVWADRAGVDIVKKQMGSDPASVAFDTLNAGVAGKHDVVIIDTAGRLHNKVNLMNELSKVKRVMQKVVDDAPHEVLLVLDASTGQNAIEQARQFLETTEVTAIALTKLDGTAKGGVVIGIADQFKIPIKFIGVGEQIDHLQLFNRDEFIDSLFQTKVES
ncbi:MAG: signal recognition particle-docking protein FtsY [Chitinophagales bacterium]|nr:signal recognition particle-docking protein FtsY [Chitinophagales bacterium]